MRKPARKRRVLCEFSKSVAVRGRRAAQVPCHQRVSAIRIVSGFRERKAAPPVTAKIHPFQAPDGEPRDKEEPFRLGPWLVQPSRNTISDGESETRLHPKAMEVLVALAERSPNVFPRDELIGHVWRDAFVGEEALTGNIGELRKAFGDDAKHPRFIETVPKRGYRLMVAVASETARPERAPTEDADADADADADTDADAKARSAPGRRSTLVVRAVGLSAAFVAALAFWLTRRDVVNYAPALRHETRFTQLTTDPGEELHPSLSPDGDFVVYIRKVHGGYWHLYRRRLGGETSFNLTEGSNADNIQPAFSPDGEQIAFRSERDGGGIFLMGATGESVRKVTDFGFNPSWSPDGTRLVVSTLRFITPHHAATGPGVQLRIVDIATGEARVLTEGRALQPSWSPHGVRIAFWGIDRDIWTIPAEGGEMARVTDDRRRWRNWNPVWSPDGRHLYFGSDRGGSMNVWRIAIEETSGRPLGEPESVTAPARYVGYFSLARSVERLAYASKTVQANVFRIGFDPVSESVQGEPIPVTQGSRYFVAPEPSPDGESVVAWMALPDEGISIVGVNGKNLRELPVGPSRFPRWSPDGRRLAFNSNPAPDETLEAWTINTDGSGLRRVTDTSTQSIVVEYPFWSPDGSRIVVGATDSVHIFDLDRNETSYESLPIQGDRGSGFSPFSWSPDGAWLAGHFEHDGEQGIGVLALPSVALTRLTDLGRFPVWLADSRRILFVDPLAHELYLVDRVTSETRKIYIPEGTSVEFANFASISKDNRTLFYTLFTPESDIWLADLDTAH